MPTQSFTWIPFYQELATKLAGWEKRQGELVAFLEALREEGYVVTPLYDKDQNGARFLLKEIDPFTFFGVFNRGIGFDQRLAILARIRQHFRVKNDVPEDFNGVPVLNNFKSWFFPYQNAREKDDVGRLWQVFRLGLGKDPLGKKQFLRAFDAALTVKQTNVNLTMGLFWIRPHTFLSLDQVNRVHLDISLPSGGLTAKFYVETVEQFQAGKKSFPEISLEAWGAENARVVSEPKRPRYRTREEINYWLVGAFWDDQDPADQTERFLAEGIWENAYDNRQIRDVLDMRVNDRIAIKAASTQRKACPLTTEIEQSLAWSSKRSARSSPTAMTAEPSKWNGIGISWKNPGTFLRTEAPSGDSDWTTPINTKYYLKDLEISSGMERNRIMPGLPRYGGMRIKQVTLKGMLLT